MVELSIDELRDLLSVMGFDPELANCSDIAWALRRAKEAAEKESKQRSCQHVNTRIEESHDSHYKYEDTVCKDCGKTVDSFKW